MGDKHAARSRVARAIVHADTVLTALRSKDECLIRSSEVRQYNVGWEHER